MGSSHGWEAAADLAAVLGCVKQGTLRMFGDCFGRPCDDIRIVRTVRAAERDLIIGFDLDQGFIIADPADWSFSTDTFRICEASRIIRSAQVLDRAIHAT